ncbi:MAG: flagellar protein export ATPase FliI [Candidatus Thiodiazotropha sp. (ex Ctena orbiculata)]|uniref:Flagellum-specific ATP synthase n=1 Tax=Candidatus Thiodiazotropha taylori TaxID=2792791 RepID=A0A944MCC4_9GAMM|nr:flagellar protein export ATPase FliI [Candidatus Thiodiazotropha taylori]PUB89656.1 MAG: flagellar protein export ATPase FliI [gamma proteobacterium symbiont of Ctena orbiculata]MBT2990802.1 flagellar protein export ATPase FliI [Candidatus Thiodiazotropha taylori]MBT2997752.1 flagellar protein export ATPase FliI [Candidatus Thiodiazotropha taylori]MBT3000479.1 flagellar protein export ATPase FliI [Candidatus Thiodiazotropha taylori]
MKVDSINVERQPIWAERLRQYQDRLGGDRGLVVEGRLTRMVGLTLEAIGCRAAIGGQCDVVSSNGTHIEAEVVGFGEESLYLMPTGNIQGLEQGARVIPTGRVCEAVVGEQLLGRVIDGAGKPLDGFGAIHSDEHRPLTGRTFNPLARTPIREPLDVGVRAINALLSVGRGQRLGLFAGSGVGKSVLLGMMTRYTNADVTVVALIGERGREVKEFVENILGKEGLKRAVVVAVPADNPPLRRIHGAMLATSIAESFREQGKHVLLLMDSLTRFAQAQREIALAIHEPPATKGYPPSVFAKMPQLVERAGNGDKGGGSITAFYTVLTEGDDQNDPIADAARAILDGHFVLSRRLADAGHYPAIDIEASISRAMNDVTNYSHQEAARSFKHLYSVYQQNRDLISVGAYEAGSDEQIDIAISAMPALSQFLRQDMYTRVTLEQSLEDLEALFPAEDVSDVELPEGLSLPQPIED